MSRSHLKIAVIFATFSTLTACNTVPKSDNSPSHSAVIAAAMAAQKDHPLASLEGTAFVTDKFDETVEFYTQILGFKIISRKTLDNPSTHDAFGLSEGQALDYVGMVPTGSSLERPYAGVNVARVINLDGSPVNLSPSPWTQDSNRSVRLGDQVMAYRVTDIDAINAKMEAANVTYLTPLTTSPTGLSKIMNVLDPNGFRLQLYQFGKK